MDAPVVAVGVDESGVLGVPEDVATAGWYRFGPLPGSVRGSAVITGHIDDHLQGVGAFASILGLGIGDPIEVMDAHRVTHRFTVIAREEWRKAEVPISRLFQRSGSPRLVLITCGGPFDAGTRSYRDNVAVTAIPSGR